MLRSLTRSALALLRYLFHPNPGHAVYGEPTIVTMLIFCAALIVASIVIRLVRRKVRNTMTRTLSRSWSSATFWYGVTGLVLVVARVEAIQFMAMRFVWVLWWGSMVLYILFQMRQFMTRHYEVVREVRMEDPLMKYLPRKKKH